MHKFLSTTELLLEVCEELLSVPGSEGRSGLVSFGGTCQALQPVVRSVLWRDPDPNCLKALCEILLDETAEGGAQTISAATRLERFKIYADEVRYLEVYPSHKKLVTKALSAFSEMAGEGIHPFPRLLSLAVTIGLASDIHLVEVLGHVNLKQFEIRFYKYDWEFQTKVVSIIQQRLTGLENLFVTFPPEPEGETGRVWSFNELLKSLPHLYNFTLSAACVGFAPLLDGGLSCGKQLRTLTLHHLQSPDDRDRLTLKRLSTAALSPFGNLQVLNLESSVTTANELLSYLSSSPIEGLWLSLLVQRGNTLQMSVREELNLWVLDGLARCIAEYERLADLVILVSTSHDYADDTENPSPFPWKYLAHLYGCKSLSSFDIFFDVPTRIVLDDKDISDMAHAWPRLRLLWIRWSDNGITSLLDKENLTPAGFQPLADKCPELEHIRLSGLNANGPRLPTTFVGPLRHPYILYMADDAPLLDRFDKVASVLPILWPNRIVTANFIPETDVDWRPWPRYPDCIVVIIEEVYETV